MKGTPLLLVVVLMACSLAAPAVEWPQWRGPGRDAVIVDPNHPLNSLPAEPKVLWKMAAGLGQASPVVAGGKLVFLDSENQMETVHCVDAETGKVAWSVPLAPTAQFENNYGDGPRCTPLIEGDRVYVQSCTGEFRCLQIADGKTIWHVNFQTDYGATFLGNKSADPESKETASRRHGNNGSAAIDGARIFVPVGSPKGATLVCFDKLTGKELWRAGNDNTAYTSIVVGTLAGVRQAIHFTATALMGVATENGKILWRVPLKTNANRHVCTPVLSGDTVTVTSTSIGTRKYLISQKEAEFAADQVWVNDRLKTVIGTPVLLGGKYLFTLGPGSRTDLVCVDFATGKELWAQPGLGDYASLTVINDKLVALNSTGELLLLETKPDGYREAGRLQVSGKTWASLAYWDGRFYIKDDANLTALTLAP